MLPQIPLFLVLISILQKAQSSYRPKDCSNPLGMQSGTIKDEDITASSSHAAQSLPQFGRLGYEAQGGAWCPNNSDPSPWLKIDLHKRHALTGIATQGRYGNGIGQEYVETYTLQYYDPLRNEWQFYRNKAKSEFVEGNNDTNSIKKTFFDNVIMTDKVQIFPIKRSMTRCLRVELYGCLWPEGVVRTYVQQGNGKPVENGIAPLFDYIIPSSATDEGWMVWSNATLQGEPLEFVFEFDTIRVFQAVHVLVKEPFKSGVITLSIDGEYYSNPLIWEPGEGSNLTCNLDNQIGRYLKMQLRVKGQFLTLGEIDFDSSLDYYDYRCYHTPEKETSTIFALKIIIVTLGISLLVAIIIIIILAIIMIKEWLKKQRLTNGSGERMYYTIPVRKLETHGAPE